MTATVLQLHAELEQVCRICTVSLPLSRFYVSKSNRSGRNYACIECLSAVHKERYRSNPEPAKARAKAFRQSNPGKYKASKRAQYIAHKAQHNAATKAWRIANADRKRAKDREWRENNKDRKRANDRAWQLANAERKTATARDGHLRRKFGISLAYYNELLVAQDNRCAICRGVEPGGPRGASFAVDHDHATGAVRGLLCFSCNTALGHFKESTELLLSAAAYLEAATKAAQV